MVCAFLDPIFFPIAPEIYLAALILAKPEAWKRYLPACIAASTLGAAAGYMVGALLFQQFGLPIIEFFHLEQAFTVAQQQLGANVFTAMLLVPFTLVPEKVFVIAAGFLSAPFFLFILGFFVGRSVRITLIVYLVHRFGERILKLIGRYFLAITVIVLSLVAYYGIVHLHLLPL
jgi:membrane protein YqaA with SNARE-associated domain